MCPGAGRIARGFNLSDDELEFIRRALLCVCIWGKEGSFEQLRGLFLAFHWPHVFVTLFNWGVGSGEGMGSSLCGIRGGRCRGVLGLAEGGFLDALGAHCASRDPGEGTEPSAAPERIAEPRGLWKRGALGCCPPGHGEGLSLPLWGASVRAGGREGPSRDVAFLREDRGDPEGLLK